MSYNSGKLTALWEGGLVQRHVVHCAQGCALQIGVDPDVVLSARDCWSRCIWFFRHAFTKHSDYCFEVKKQIIYYG